MISKNKKISNVFSWTNQDVEVMEVAHCGNGIYAKRNIKKGSLIAVFGGYVMSVKEEQKLPEHMNDNAVQISDDLVLGIKKESEIEMACFFNHSCDPNAGFNGQIFLVAMRDIKKNQQVTFDYGMVLFRSRSGGRNYKFPCSCGEEGCRKVITNQDWKIKELQKRYKGYFQYYLEDKIKKENK